MELAIQKIAVISFFIIGLSHVVQPRVWARLFIEIRNKGEVGSFIVAFIHLPLGILIVGFHDVWQGVPLLLTLCGYGWTLKGLIYFVFPKMGLKMMSRVSLERSREFVIPGMVLIGIGGLLTLSIIGGL